MRTNIRNSIAKRTGKKQQTRITKRVSRDGAGSSTDGQMDFGLAVDVIMWAVVVFDRLSAEKAPRVRQSIEQESDRALMPQSVESMITHASIRKVIEMIP